MRVKRVHHLAVVHEGAVAGIVSHHDLRAVTSASTRVADVFSAPLATATPHTTVRQAANLLRGRAIGCLVIVEDEKPVGIVTVSDLLGLIGRGVERPVPKSKRWTLKHRGPRRAALQR